MNGSNNSQSDGVIDDIRDKVINNMQKLVNACTASHCLLCMHWLGAGCCTSSSVRRHKLLHIIYHLLTDIIYHTVALAVVGAVYCIFDSLVDRILHLIRKLLNRRDNIRSMKSINYSQAQGDFIHYH